MKRHLWVVEYFVNGEWKPDYWGHSNRKGAREEARLMAMDMSNKTRVRKYIPQEETK